MSCFALKITLSFGLATLLLAFNISARPYHGQQSDTKYKFNMTLVEQSGIVKVIYNRVTCQAIREAGTHCPYHPNYQATSKNFFVSRLSERSTSPWVAVWDYDRHRDPQSLPWVCCACRHCAIRTGPGVFVPDQRRFSFPVKVDRTVTSRDPQSGHELKRSVSTPVACTCSEPKETSSTSSSSSSSPGLNH